MPAVTDESGSMTLEAAVAAIKAHRAAFRQAYWDGTPIWLNGYEEGLAAALAIIAGEVPREVAAMESRAENRARASAERRSDWLRQQRL